MTAKSQVMAVDMSYRLGWIDKSIVTRVQNILKQAKLPTAPPETMTVEMFKSVMAVSERSSFPFKKNWENGMCISLIWRCSWKMKVDKKVADGLLRLILLKGPLGNCVFTGDYDRKALDETLHAFCNSWVLWHPPRSRICQVFSGRSVLVFIPEINQECFALSSTFFICLDSIVKAAIAKSVTSEARDEWINFTGFCFPLLVGSGQACNPNLTLWESEWKLHLFYSYRYLFTSCDEVLLLNKFLDQIGRIPLAPVALDPFGQRVSVDEEVGWCMECPCAGGRSIHPKPYRRLSGCLSSRPSLE